MTRWRGIVAVALVLGAAGLACGAHDEDAPPGAAPSALAREWADNEAIEERIHALRPSLRALERGIANLHIPDAGGDAVFAEEVRVRDLEPAPTAPETVSASLGIEARRWLPMDAAAPVARSALEIWAPLLATAHEIDGASLAIVDGDFTDAARTGFRARVKFGARVRLAGGGRAAWRSKLELEWQAPASSDDAWRIVAFRSGPIDEQRSEALLFREVLAAALPDPATVAAARHSQHEALVLDRLLDPDGFEAPTPHFFEASQDRHPGIAVADVDADGDDDFLVASRWGPLELYLNRGDGRFDERARELGLELVDHAAAALFADFDNDGDLDLFVGRTLAPSRYYEQHEGRFLDRSAERFGGAPLPQLVSALSAVDVDRDGLLDLYVSTYAAQLTVVEREAQVRRARTTGGGDSALLGRWLPDDDANELGRLAAEAGAHTYLSLPGPPNLLYRNRGGAFVEDRDAGPLRAFRNTYQASWSDVDRDGDDDLYLAHDFSPNQLLRNDGGRFVDVTEESGTADIGFGMGASWGDVDRDGRPDLYVSNMYSKAGRRITARFDALDARFAQMARGNSLFRNDGGRFTRVSGLEPPALQVEVAGWSWGGQFGDVENDGFLDLFVLSGYYTAPIEAHRDVDT